MGCEVFQGTKIAKVNKKRAADPTAMAFLSMVPEALEGMIRDDWAVASYDPRLSRVKLREAGTGFHLNKDTRG